VICPIDGKVFTQAAHSSKEDVALAVDKAHEAFQTWEKLQLRSSILLNKIAQVEDNLEYLATVETIDNGKRYVKQWPLILGSRPFYFASVIRAEESSIAELDSQTVTIALSEPLG
jgi:aldehyde dehydrogenase